MPSILELPVILAVCRYHALAGHAFIHDLYCGVYTVGAYVHSLLNSRLCNASSCSTVVRPLSLVPLAHFLASRQSLLLRWPIRPLVIPIADSDRPRVA